MFGDQKDIQKNLKDFEKDSITDTSSMPIPYQSLVFGFGSYTKTNKLITALYMVTDIIDKDEPLRNKLRTLGTEIISDIHTAPSDILIKISQVMSFLDIASAMNIISEMNTNILRKEFMQLNQSVKESTGIPAKVSKQINLSEFFREPVRAGGELEAPKQDLAKDKYKSIGHQYSTRIGVQKGSTLMKALSDKTSVMSNMNMSDIKNSNRHKNDFDILKQSRQSDIINCIKKNGGNATITDIRTKGEGTLPSCGEKTLQRELVSMVKAGVLNKTGEKRWSRYFLKS